MIWTYPTSFFIFVIENLTRPYLNIQISHPKYLNQEWTKFNFKDILKKIFSTYVSRHLCILDKSIWRSLRDIKSKKKKKKYCSCIFRYLFRFQSNFGLLDFRLKKIWTLSTILELAQKKTYIYAVVLTCNWATI